MTWDYLTSPIRRPQWNSDAVVEASPTGRRGIGTVNHCIHGKDAIVEEVLDYRPYDHVTIRSQLPIPGTPKLVHSWVLQDGPDGGTHVEMRSRSPKPRDRAAFDQLLPTVKEIVSHSHHAIAPSWRRRRPPPAPATAWRSRPAAAVRDGAGHRLTMSIPGVPDRR